MVRGLVALIASVSLVAAALAAPMTHVHEDGDDHHDGAPHRGRLVHSHGGGHHHHGRTATGPALEAHTPGERGQITAINAFQLATGPAQALDAFVSAIFTLAPPVLSPGAMPRIVPQSHDPPGQRSLSSRAPPFLLS